MKLQKAGHIGGKVKKVALPRICSTMERRVMTRVPGTNQWASRLETEGGGEKMISMVTNEMLPIDVCIVPQVSHTENPECKIISTLSVMLYLDIGEMTSINYG